MKKFFLILTSIFLLSSSFALGFFLKKSIDDKKIDALLNTKSMLEKKIEKYAEEIINLKNKDIKEKTEPELGTWKKLTDNIYIDENSIAKTQSTVSAWFKMYNEVDDIPVYYELIKYEADCNALALCLNYIKQYDINDNILSDEPNNNGVCYNGSGGWINGEIAYKALCNYTPDGK